MPLRGSKTIFMLFVAAAMIYYIQVSTRPLKEEMVAVSNTKRPASTDFLEVAARQGREVVAERRSKKGCCAALHRVEDALMILPSDIQNLLPILYAYYSEEDMLTIAEAGSRFGSSTAMLLKAATETSKKRCVTIDTFIRSSVELLYRCARTCVSGDFKPQDFQLVAGNDLLVEIPFWGKKNGTAAKPLKDQSVALKTPFEKRSGKEAEHFPFDALFIDTMHNGDQLTMELRRYAPLVRKYLFFHDSYSYKDRDEFPAEKAIGFDGAVRPRGIQTPLQEFLMANPDWIEEMNNMHNNGLFILRRKTAGISLSVESPGLPIENRDIVESIVLHPVNEVDISKSKCVDNTKKIFAHFKKGGSDDISYFCIDWRLNHRQTPVVYLYAQLCITDIPVSRYLPLIMSNVAALKLAESSKKTVFIGCEVAPFIAFAHGAYYNQVPSSYYIDPAHPCDERVEAVLRNYSKKTTELSDVGVVVVSASSLHASTGLVESIAKETNMRIVSYGVSTVNMDEVHAALLKSNFELKTSLKRSVGFAMWEKKGSTQLLYLPAVKASGI